MPRLPPWLLPIDEAAALAGVDPALIHAGAPITLPPLVSLNADSKLKLAGLTPDPAEAAALPAVRVGLRRAFVMRPVASAAALRASLAGWGAQADPEGDADPAVMAAGGGGSSGQTIQPEPTSLGPRAAAVVAVLRPMRGSEAPTPQSAAAGAAFDAPAAAAASVGFERPPHVSITIEEAGAAARPVFLGAAEGGGGAMLGGPSRAGGMGAGAPPQGAATVVGGHQPPGLQAGCDLEAPPSDDGRSTASTATSRRGGAGAGGRRGGGVLLRGFGGCLRFPLGGKSARSMQTGGGARDRSLLRASPGAASGDERGGKGPAVAAAASRGPPRNGGPPGCWGPGLRFLHGRPAAPLSMQVKVEPKTFFANERTLLQWLSSSILVIFTALSLLTGTFSGGGGMPSGSGGGTSQSFASRRGAALVGAILAPIGIAFMGYALYTYVWRARMIARRQLVRYDDQVGPFVLVFGLITAVIAGYVIIITSFNWSGS